jgi:DNA-3-methyladenine glycosylase I
MGMTSSKITDDGKPRCSWCAVSQEYIQYHDFEWGYPVTDDIRLFEKICLESFQSGLSWRTILAKRENFRRAFHGFDFQEIASFQEKDVLKLLADEGIVRHRGKIEATINNAQRAIELVNEFGSLAAYFWSYSPADQSCKVDVNVSITDESVALAKDLKKRGWKFVGPTTVYAFMQAMGLVNDHSEGCVIRAKVEQARKTFDRPVS